jgi:hypothetical protein
MRGLERRVHSRPRPSLYRGGEVFRDRHVAEKGCSTAHCTGLLALHGTGVGDSRTSQLQHTPSSVYCTNTLYSKE